MDKIVAKVAGFGVPGLALLLAINATGLAGAAAITTALASLGPAGMLGGIATLGIMGTIVNGVTKFGFDAIYSGVIKELFNRGENYETIREKIEKYPVSKDLKRKLLEQLDAMKEKDSKSETIDNDGNENDDEDNARGDESDVKEID